MIRSGIARKPATAREPMKGARTRKCAVKGCMGRYVPGDDQRRVWCSDDCSVTLALAALAKRRAAAARAQKAAAKVERAETAALKAKAKPRAAYMREAQAALNKWIREVRDKGKPCISCGHTDHGQKFDAGHYITRGSRPNLALVENNLARQCHWCNVHLSGNQILFRRGLVARIGLEAVEALEADQEPRKYSIEQLQAIKADYLNRIKQHKAK